MMAGLTTHAPLALRAEDLRTALVTVIIEG